MEQRERQQAGLVRGGREGGGPWGDLRPFPPLGGKAPGEGGECPSCSVWGNSERGHPAPPEEKKVVVHSTPPVGGRPSYHDDVGIDVIRNWLIWIAVVKDDPGVVN